MKKKLIVVFCLFALFSCSGKSESELMESAKKNIEDKNYKEALRDYEQIVSEFPDSENRGIVNFEIAQLYNNNLAGSLGNKESMEKAIEHYEVVYEEYPGMAKAPAALFMTAYLQANELHRFDDAKETYNLFLKRYPDHEFAVSAKIELENLGLSPEEILKKSSGDLQ